jgi:hypothetical protein
LPSVIGGEGDLDQTQQQLADLHLAVVVRPEWLAYVRVNFTLGDD